MSSNTPQDDPLRRLLETGSDEEIVLVLAGRNPQAVADVLEDMPESVRVRAFNALGTLSQSRILREIEDDDVREDLIDELSDADLADIVEAHKSDDATDLIEELDDVRRERVLAELEPEKRAEIQELSRHDPETAGGIMQTELLRLQQGLTVTEAIEVVRREYSPRMGDLHDVWVVDDAGLVKGRVRSRQLLTTNPSARVGDIMVRDVLTVPVTMDQEEIADLVQDYDLTTVAVVDAAERLIGRIMVDDILDVVQEEATEDAALQAGTTPDDIHSRSVALTVRSRLPWLVATFAGGLVTIFLITSLEADLVKRVTLVPAVIPIIAGMSGNVGTQAASVTVRGIAVGEVDYGRLGKVLWKELSSGLVFAAFFGALLYAYVLWVLPVFKHVDWLGEDPAWVALVPAVAILCTIISGAAMGTLVPLTLHRLGKDPAVASGPFITTMNDLVGISVLAMIVRLLLT